VEGFQGDGNFLSKFGIEMPDQLEVSVAIRTFEDEVAALEPNLVLTRPREGDLLFFNQRKAPFQISFVDKRAIFYPLGSLHVYKMTIELYRYSGEKFNTGITAIDALEQKYSNDLIHWAIHNEDGDYWIYEVNDVIVDESYGVTSPEPTDDSVWIQDEANDFIIQSNSDPFSWGNQ
jgi:hypothetical protein